jgi:hypothetical protein
VAVGVFEVQAAAAVAVCWDVIGPLASAKSSDTPLSASTTRK